MKVSLEADSLTDRALGGLEIYNKHKFSINQPPHQREGYSIIIEYNNEDLLSITYRLLKAVSLQCTLPWPTCVFLYLPPLTYFD